MQRETPEDSWTVTEVAQMSSVQAYGSLSIRDAWKNRLIKSTLVGLNFYTILGFEYHINIMKIIALIIVLKFLAFLLSEEEEEDG